MNSQAVGAEFVRRLCDPVLGVLSIEWLSGIRRRDFVSVVVALGLAGADNPVTQRVFIRKRRSCEQDDSKRE